MTGKYSISNSNVEFWTDLTVKLVDMVSIGITMYLCQGRCIPINNIMSYKGISYITLLDVQVLHKALQ